ncbi:MAG: hypothetical protein GY795_26730 [Desulfobacterales bacterium]|nr:hypothetical protein [Desulfobacterales bacterium]
MDYPVALSPELRISAEEFTAVHDDTVGKFYSFRADTSMPQSGKVIKPGVFNPRLELLLIFAP